MPRTSQEEVYRQIINDLKEAKELLPTAYSGTERIRPNKWAATALLARTYLYNRSWIEAETESSLIINSGVYSLPTNLNNVFLKTSAEAIWQLQAVNPNLNTWEGNLILFAAQNNPPTFLLQEGLFSSFKPGDARKVSWTGSRNYLGDSFHYPYKYKVYGNNAPITEYYMVLRLAEQYLIRAEARTMSENMTGARDDLNTIRTRAGLPNTIASSRETLLIAIENEKRHEFFAEWGHRWFDIKRWGKANNILSALKPSTWQAHQILWPIPIGQINANPMLIQNPGY